MDIRRNEVIVTTAQRHLLPLDALDPASFERLCMWVMQRFGFHDVAHYGDAGADGGRDVVARDADGRSWVLQAKRCHLGPSAAVKALAEAVASQDADGVIVASSHSLSATARDALTIKANELKVEFLAWGRTEIDEKVKASPEILNEFFLQSTGSVRKLITLEVSNVKWDEQDNWHKDPGLKSSTLYVPIIITNKAQVPIFVDRPILKATDERPYGEEVYEFTLGERFNLDAQEELILQVSAAEIETRGCHVDAAFVAIASIQGTIKSKPNVNIQVPAFA